MHIVSLCSFAKRQESYDNQLSKQCLNNKKFTLIQSIVSTLKPHNIIKKKNKDFIQLQNIHKNTVE